MWPNGRRGYTRAYHFQAPTTVPCKWCDTPTEHLGTKCCDRHWELQQRVAAEPAMALKMLKELGHAV
jgi:hypothetical protein